MEDLKIVTAQWHLGYHFQNTFFLQTFFNIAVCQCFFPLVRETVEIIMVVELHNKIPQTDRDTHTHILKRWLAEGFSPYLRQRLISWQGKQLNFLTPNQKSPKFENTETRHAGQCRVICKDLREPLICIKKIKWMLKSFIDKKSPPQKINDFIYINNMYLVQRGQQVMTLD